MDVFSDTTGEKYLYRYRPDSVYTIDEILNQYVRFSMKDSLNDVFEFSFGGFLSSNRTSLKEKNILLHKLFSRLNATPEPTIKVSQSELIGIETNPDLDHFEGRGDELIGMLESAARSQIETMERHLNKVAVSCFCKKPLNATMMGHYCNNSKGLLISFKRKHLESSLSDISKLLDVIYSSEPYKMSLETFLDSSQVADWQLRNELLARKHSDWIYEDEVRAIIPNPEVSGTNFYFDLSCIAGVCFAPSANEAFKRVVCSICRQMNIPVYECKKIDGTYDFKSVLVAGDKYLCATP